MVYSLGIISAYPGDYCLTLQRPEICEALLREKGFPIVYCSPRELLLVTDDFKALSREGHRCQSNESESIVEHVLLSSQHFGQLIFEKE